MNINENKNKLNKNYKDTFYNKLKKNIFVYLILLSCIIFKIYINIKYKSILLRLDLFVSVNNIVNNINKLFDKYYIILLKENKNLNNFYYNKNNFIFLTINIIIIYMFLYHMHLFFNKKLYSIETNKIIIYICFIYIVFKLLKYIIICGFKFYSLIFKSIIINFFNLNNEHIEFQYLNYFNEQIVFQKVYKKFLKELEYTFMFLIVTYLNFTFPYYYYLEFACIAFPIIYLISKIYKSMYYSIICLTNKHIISNKLYNQIKRNILYVKNILFINSFMIYNISKHVSIISCKIKINVI